MQPSLAPEARVGPAMAQSSWRVAAAMCSVPNPEGSMEFLVDSSSKRVQDSISDIGLWNQGPLIRVRHWLRAAGFRMLQGCSRSLWC